MQPSATPPAERREPAVAAELQAHPAAELFPMMTGAEFEGLVADIRENGLRENIVVYEGMVLDGRNRLRACRQLGIEIMKTPFRGPGTPEAFVISKNLHRRHLTESQRAVIAKRLANIGHGGDRRSDQAANLPLETPAAKITQDAAAEMLNVSVRAVRNAGVVLSKGTPEEIEAVERGEETVHAVIEKIRSREPETSSTRVEEVDATTCKTAPDKRVKKPPPTVVKLGPDQPEGFYEATQTMGAITTLSNWCRKHTPAFVAGGMKDHEIPEDIEPVEIALAWLQKFHTILKERCQ